MKKKSQEQPTAGQEELSPETGNQSTDQAADASGDNQQVQDGANRIAELEKAVSVLEDSLKTTRDQLLRTMAEFENFRRRVDAEKQDLLRYGGESIIRDLLNVIDDFERSLSVENADEETYRQGVKLIYTNLIKVLESRGLKPLETVGKPFNVDEHDALLHVEKEGAEPDTITEEVQKGYTFNGKVIRHAKVLVAK